MTYTSFNTASIGNKVHAAWLAETRTDVWWTLCGLEVEDISSLTHHTSIKITCDLCVGQMERADNMHKASE